MKRLLSILVFFLLFISIAYSSADAISLLPLSFPVLYGSFGYAGEYAVPDLPSQYMMLLALPAEIDKKGIGLRDVISDNMLESWKNTFLLALVSYDVMNGDGSGYGSITVDASANPDEGSLIFSVIYDSVLLEYSIDNNLNKTEIDGSLSLSFSFFVDELFSVEISGNDISLDGDKTLSGRSITLRACLNGDFIEDYAAMNGVSVEELVDLYLEENEDAASIIDFHKDHDTLDLLVAMAFLDAASADSHMNAIDMIISLIEPYLYVDGVLMNDVDLPRFLKGIAVIQGLLGISLS